jgi:hypothetical protein
MVNRSHSDGNKTAHQTARVLHDASRKLLLKAEGVVCSMAAAVIASQLKVSTVAFRTMHF